jgi:hypothetical protein
MSPFEGLISGILNSHTWLNQANTMNILTLALTFCVQSLNQKCYIGMMIVRPMIFRRNRCRRHSRI